MRPSVSTVQAAEDAIDFYPCPDHTMIVGVHYDAGHEGYANGALAGDVHSQFLPPQSAISRAIDRSRARAGKENIGIDRVDGQRPDRWHSPIGPIGPIGGETLPPPPPNRLPATTPNPPLLKGMSLRRLDGPRPSAAYVPQPAAHP